MIKKYKNISWDYIYVSRNPNINIEFVINNLDKIWNWYWLSNNEAITEEDKIRYYQLPWVKN